MTHVFKGDFSKLESDTRKKILPVTRILEQIGIKRDDIIIDFGCGIGYFSIPAAKKVGETGKIIAIDNSDVMITELTKRAYNIKNIDIIKSDTIYNLSADIILLIQVLHEVDDPKTFLENCFKNLSLPGRVIIIDWQKKASEIGPPVEHRIAKEEVIKMTDRKVIEHEIDQSQYFLEINS